jgi:AbrB family looped-hinge helix DNA binding protein
MSQLEVKEVDDQGRIIIPKAWRSMLLKGKKVVMRLKDDSIEIAPYRQEDLTKFFDVAAVDVRGSLDDWHALRKELRRGRR